jgi:acetyltransferase-like isoleucine patch superfamily enzyme
MRKIIREFLWIISEVEAMIAKPNDALTFRRLYLHFQKVKHGKNLWVGRGLRFLNSSNLILGECCALGDFVRIATHAPITIGDDFIGSTGLHLDSGTHDPISLTPKALPIHIGNRVWCGINVTILAGVTIGDDVVIGAGSVVCKDIPSNSIAVGVPAKVIKPLDRDPNKPIWTWVSKN